MNVIFVICLLPSMLIVGSTAISVGKATKNETIVKRGVKIRCEIDDKEPSCEKCVQKGTNTPPANSELKNPHIHCPSHNHLDTSVDWSTVMILGMVFFAIVIGVMCSCFIYFCVICSDFCRQMEHAKELRKSKKAAEAKIAMKHQQEQRKAERKALRDSIRQKYGPYYNYLYQKVPHWICLSVALHCSSEINKIPFLATEWLVPSTSNNYHNLTYEKEFNRKFSSLPLALFQDESLIT
uniref:Uncharacterized protein n=1 Tax=Setaria digitata TaxID=48799 RepID=A0A915PR57_9BILA